MSWSSWFASRSARPDYPFDTPDILQGAVNIGIGYFPLYRLFVIGVTAVVLLALWLFLEKTCFGLIIRAGARDPQIVRVLGIDVGAGLADRVRHRHRASPAWPGCWRRRCRASVPEMGDTILAEAFVVTVVGGMGSLRRRRAGRPAGRRRRQHDRRCLPRRWRKVAIFALMAVVLLVRPQGFFGRAGLMS